MEMPLDTTNTNSNYAKSFMMIIIHGGLLSLCMIKWWKK